MAMNPLFAIVLLLIIYGCAVPPSHPSLKDAAMPKLIPTRDFVGDPEWNGYYAVSPDGKKLSWLSVKGLHFAIFVKAIGLDKVKTYAVKPPRDIKWGKMLFLVEI